MRDLGTAALVLLLAASHRGIRAQDAAAPQPDLVFPGLLEQAAREAGNPLATYARMVSLAERYSASKVFAGIYAEVRANYEEFLGLPLAGVEAMALPSYRSGAAAQDQAIPEGFMPEDALSVIIAAGGRTRIVVFGEEHHLPQTRSLYEPMLRELWKLGFRYLAAETFTDAVMQKDFEVPDYRSGFYLMDPVFAAAVRLAAQLGYKLVAYDTTERGPAGDGSFRDRRQAENIVARVFAKDPLAKVLILAGRGHAAEVPPPDGWQPMASVLKQTTGIDPFTVYAPTMSQRRDPAQEHPLYRDATARGLVVKPTVFAHRDVYLGPGSCDAYVFWPRFAVEQGRADWLRKTLGRSAVPVPAALVGGKGLRLIQAFREGDPSLVVPADQVLLQDEAPVPVLMLPPGNYWLRRIDAAGATVGPVATRI